MIDATVGGVLTDSYLSVAAADALARDDLGPSAARWRQSTTTLADRERALVRATREIEAHMRSSQLRYSQTQALAFPRAIDVVASLAIASSSIANPTVVTTMLPHGLASGQSVTIASHASTPSLNGTHVVTVIDETTFTVPVAVTVAATGGTITGSAAFPYLLAGIRHATYAQAKFLLAGGADMADATTMRAARGMTSASEPNVSYTQDRGMETPFIAQEALAHLAGVLGGSATVKSVKLSTDYRDVLGLEVLA